MNKDRVLESLIVLLNGILFHENFLPELIGLIAEKGVEKQIFKLLSKQLILLNRNGILVTNAKEFENIGSGLFSMHLTGSGFNLRILFAFLPNSQPVLLLPFYERAGKRKTDYSGYIEPALTRFNEMREEYEHGQI